MVGKYVRAIGIGKAQRSAALFNARERRLSLAGVPELFRTNRFSVPDPQTLIDDDLFEQVHEPVTFRTKIRITNGSFAHGLIFEIGDATTCTVAWLDDNGVMWFRSGDDTTDNFVSVSFNNGDWFTENRELDLIFAVIPGTGEACMWINGREVARAKAGNGQLVNGWTTTAGDARGVFCGDAVGALPADVTQTAAPDGFVAIQPLSVYQGQAPRHFV